MRPHPAFVNKTIPQEHPLGAFVLKMLTVDDLDRDFQAVTMSAADIRKKYPNNSWPEGLTRDGNLIDLAWHQREFQARRSFAWVIEDGSGTYLGCVYVFPSIAGEQTADIMQWWKTGVVADHDDFEDRFSDWLAGPDWPDLEYRPMV